MYRIRLENTVTHQIYEQQVEDLNNGDKLYYNFGINTVDLVDGEYILTLFDADGNVLAEDLLRIGDFNPDTIQYTKGENTFIAVQLDAKLGSKQAHIEDIETTIYPNNGFDGMTDVYVNAQPLYDNAYSDGYNSGYGVGLEESYPKGYEDGYGNGKTDGYNEGYNIGSAEGYPKGYEDGQEDVAKNARVLEITKNGIYTSKYSEIEWNEPVTGVYNDGTEYYSYVDLVTTVYDTGIPATQDSKLEFWWKSNNSVRINGTVVGAQHFNGYIFKFVEYSTNVYKIEFGNYKVGNLFTYSFEYDMTSKWAHISLSKKDGLVVDGQLITTIDGEKWADNETIPNFWINTSYNEEMGNTADGSFGMIKINDTVIIPTENGFLNTSTNELLTMVASGDYEYKNLEVPVAEGDLIKTVNVNIIPSVNVAKTKLKFAYSGFEEIPQWADFTNIVDTSYLFYQCGKLGIVPYFDTSKVTDMSYMFYSCGALKSIPQFDTSNVTNMNRMFYSDRLLETVPYFNTSNVTDMSYMFYSCESIKSIPQFDTSNVTNMSYMFGYCVNLISVPPLNAQKLTSNQMFSSTNMAITDFGGLIGLNCNFNGSYAFNRCPNLSYESCINILNGLADVTELGKRTLKVHQNFLDLVGDEITIGTNKGWTISA